MFSTSAPMKIEFPFFFFFSIRLEIPNALTLVAIANGNAILSGPNPKRFSSADELAANL